MLLVSIHDVTPAHGLQVKRLWDLCASRAVVPALLVVPNWHGAWPLDSHPEFLLWLRGCVAGGAEILLHGERHDEVGLPRGLKDHWRAWGRTEGEGEFLTLDARAARERITRGLDLLRRVDLAPLGFVPPAWLAGQSTYEAAAGAGLGFSEDRRSIRLLRTGERLSSPAVRWSARSAPRAWGSVAVAAGRWAIQAGSRWPRIALHPGDLDHPATASSVVRTLDRWLERHRPGRYQDLRARTS